ncbi:MAG: hypothetical protein DRJ38_00185 [Thermoprotei archaeon]|nr:MAG: hypothetical protein DRJ38_00185 [Thermoprotei archaeon]
MKRIYKTYFHAAHRIEGHPKCGRTHGHTYHLEVVIDIDGWIDFHDVKMLTWEVVKWYDHEDLGNMTCEQLALCILRKLWTVFPKANEITVRLFETPEFGVEVTQTNPTGGGES